MGAYGFCSGLGQAPIGSKSTYRPWNSGSSLVQISIIALRRSSVSLPRVRGSVPWFSISSRFQPTPTPKIVLPPDTRSRLATSLAVTIGSLSTIRATPVPSSNFSVAAAVAVRVMKGSRVLQYFRGSSPPLGQGDFRLRGMWVCSATNRESKPRSSMAVARAPGAIPSSVTNVEIPNFISSLKHTEQVRHQLTYLTDFQTSEVQGH